MTIVSLLVKTSLHTRKILIEYRRHLQAPYNLQHKKLTEVPTDALQVSSERKLSNTTNGALASVRSLR